MSQLTTRDYFAKEGVQKKFQELLGKKATGFVTSVLQIVNSNALLQKATPESVYSSAAMAATLDLPINNNLGFAWIVPYKGNAQFQMGWKGYVQLANRTGQYKAINVIEVYENQFKSFDRLLEDLDADFTLEPSGEVVGYVAYFKLLNGFEKTCYWSVNDVVKHAEKYSKTYAHSTSAWKTNFDAMAKKTVLKNALSKWGILSIEMQQAIIVDQAVINDVETLDVSYIDNSDEQLKVSISDAELIDVIESIKSGNYTIEALKNDYEVTEQQLKEVTDATV